MSYSNYDPILHRFRDTASNKYSQRSPVFYTFIGSDFVGISERCDYHDVVREIQLIWDNTGMWQTDRETYTDVLLYKVQIGTVPFDHKVY